MIINPEDILRLALAMILGGMIGAEREFRDKAAGLRTLMFICGGSALFTIFSFRLAAGNGADPTRIAAQIVTGIGFLGAGVILHERGEIHGLTTAATIWLVAGLGMGLGGGHYLFCFIAAGLTLIALAFLPGFERQMNRIHQVHTYDISAPASLEEYNQLCALFRQKGLHLLSTRRTRRGEDMLCTLVAGGSQAAHEALTEALFEDPNIKSVEI